MSTDECPVKMKLVAPPLYVLTTQTLDKTKVGRMAGQGRAAYEEREVWSVGGVGSVASGCLFALVCSILALDRCFLAGH
jgi:hypothetical protein